MTDPSESGRRMRAFARGVAGQAFEMKGGLGDTGRSLAACIILAIVAFVGVRLFQAIGIWVIVATSWIVILGFLYRFRGNIRLDRLTKALREDDSLRTPDVLRPYLPKRASTVEEMPVESP